MTDIFSKEGIQTSDINPTAPVVNAIDSQGQATSKPTGKINYDAVAQSLGDMQDNFKPADKPSSVPMALPTDQAPEAAPVVNPPVQGDLTSTAPPHISASAPKDIFAAEGIQPPSLNEINTNAVNGGIDITNPKTPEQQQLASYVDQQKEQDMTLARTRFTPEQLANFKDNPITFGDVGKFLDYTKTLPSGGIYAGINAWEMTNAAQKLKAGASVKDLSVEEQDLLLKHVDQQLEMNLRGFSFGGKVAYIGAQIPAFVTEFVATAGVGKMAQEAALKGAEELAMKGVMKAAVGGVTRTLAQTSLMLPQYTSRFGEQRINDNMALTDKGELLVRQSTESPAVSALKAFGYTAADVAGQIAVPAIGEYIVDPLTKLVKTPLISAVNNLPVAVRDGLYQAYKLIQPTAEVSKVFTTAGFKGMLEQLGANRVSEVLHATTDLATDKNYTWHDYLKNLTPSADQLLVEGGLIAIAGGIHTATSITANLLEAKGMPKGQAAETVANMSANEKEQFVEQNLPTPKSAYPTISDTAAPEKVIHPAMTDDAASSSVTHGQILAKEMASPPPVLESESGFNAAWSKVKQIYNDHIYPEVWNDIQPIQDISEKGRKAGAEIPVGEDTKYLARNARQTSELIRYNQQVATAHFNEEGNMVETGKALKAILDDFDNMMMKSEPDLATRHEDFNKFEQAQRFLYEAKKGDAYISPAQVDQSLMHLQKVVEKYGDNAKFFDTFAQERRDWRNRILFNLVQGGLKTQEWYDTTTKENPFYTPLNRVVEEEFSPVVSAKGIGKDPNANKIGSMKQFKGSDLAVKDTTESDLKNSAMIIQKSSVNRLLSSIAKYKEFYPEDVKVSNPRIIAKEVKVWYDPKLRAKLEATIAHFGDTLDRRAEVKLGKGGKGKDAGGYYSPSEKLIALKLGAGEGPLTHEVGHMLDAKLGLGEKMLADPEIKGELQKLAEDRLVGTSNLEGEDALHFTEEVNKFGSAKYREYIKNDAEVIANFFDAYVNSPEQVDKIAPKAKAAFEKIIDADPKLAFIKEIKPSTAYAEEVIQKVIRDQDGAHGSFPFYDKGSRKFLELSDPMRKALKGLQPEEIGMLEKFIGAPLRVAKRMLQKGATFMPSFAIRHFERNLMLAFLNTEGKATPLDVAKGVFDVLGRSDGYKKWSAITGKFDSFMDLGDEGLKKSYTEMFKTPSKYNKFNPIEWHAKMKEFADQPARQGIFEALKREGMSDFEAGFASIDNLVDFNRGGSFSKKIGRYAPFFNTIMQHGDVAVRAFAKKPAAYTLRAFAVITIPQMILTGYYLYGADDKTRQEYLDIPMWRKMTFTNIKIGDHWIPLPRAFAPAYVFGSIPEQIMLHEFNGYHPEAKNAWLEMLKGAANSVSPVFDWSNGLNPIIKSVFENITNYSFFLDRPIYNPDMKKLPPSERFNTYTSETAKVLGDLFNYSPAMIDNTVNDMTGNLGRFALQLGDKGINAVRGMEGKPVSQKPSEIADNPIIGGLFERNPSGSSSESAQEFYNHFEEVSQLHAALQNLDGKELSKFQRDNRIELSQYDSLTFAHKEISQLQKRSRQIYGDTNMTSDQKTEEIQNLNEQISKIARQANIHYTKSVGEK